MCDETPLVYTVEEAAALLLISRGSAYEAVRTGAIPSVRVGRRILVPRRSLLDSISEKAETEEKAEEGIE